MKLIGVLFPMIENRIANKKLKEKINNSEDIPLEDDTNSIPVEVVRKEYEESFRIKDKLEEKAKTNVIGITIVITLIMGSAGIMTSLGKKYPSTVISWVLFLVITFSITYMFFAGILAIKVLIGENEVYKVNHQMQSASEQEQCRKYLEYAALNQKKNLIRNNYVYSSYGCIRNSLVCLFIIFILLTIPIGVAGKSSSVVYVNQTLPYSITYSSTTIDSIKNIDNLVDIETKILENVGNSTKVQPYIQRVIFDDYKMFVKYEFKDNIIYVVQIESYEEGVN